VRKGRLIGNGGTGILPETTREKQLQVALAEAMAYIEGMGGSLPPRVYGYWLELLKTEESNFHYNAIHLRAPLTEVEC
jgi:hypothetical protein